MGGGGLNVGDGVVILETADSFNSCIISVSYIGLSFVLLNAAHSDWRPD